MLNLFKGGIVQREKYLGISVAELHGKFSHPASFLENTRKNYLKNENLLVKFPHNLENENGLANFADNLKTQTII